MTTVPGATTVPGVCVAKSLTMPACGARNSSKLVRSRTNVRPQPYNMATARAMMRKLVQLIWCVRDGDTLYPFEKGLIFRPINVSNAAYRKEYDDLLQHINNLIAEVK